MLVLHLLKALLRFPFCHLRTHLLSSLLLWSYQWFSLAWSAIFHKPAVSTDFLIADDIDFKARIFYFVLYLQASKISHFQDMKWKLSCQLEIDSIIRSAFKLKSFNSSSKFPLLSMLADMLESSFDFCLSSNPI